MPPVEPAFSVEQRAQAFHIIHFYPGEYSWRQAGIVHTNIYIPRRPDHLVHLYFQRLSGPVCAKATPVLFIHVVKGGSLITGPRHH